MIKAALIGAALKARLDALTFNPAVPVAWPNRKFTPDGSRYLVAEVVNAPKTRITIGGKHRATGALVVSVATPAGGGSGEADGVGDAVAAYFPADLTLALTGGGKIRITSEPSVRDGFRDGAYWRTPVTIPFEVLL